MRRAPGRRRARLTARRRIPGPDRRPRSRSIRTSRTPRRGLQIDNRPHVQAADRCVRVDAGGGAMPGDDLDEALDVVAQLLRRHRGVLDERDRLAVALHRRRQAEGRFAEAPDARLLGQVDDVPAAARESRSLRDLARRLPFSRSAHQGDRRRTPRTAARSRHAGSCCAAARRALDVRARATG